MEKVLPLSEAKAKLNALVDDVIEKDSEFIITKNGRPAAVLMTPFLYESWKETQEIQSNPELMKEIRKGLKSLRSKHKRYSFEEVFGEPIK